MFYWLIKGLAWPLVTIWLRFRRRGKEMVPATGACIVVANHTSYLDPAVLGSACPRKLRFLISRRIYSRAVLRWFYYMMDAIPVSTGRADLGALRSALAALATGQAVGIFPEGSRMRDGRVGEGKVGVAFLAARSGAPVIPAAIAGANLAMPIGAILPRPRPVRVTFGPPMRLSGGGSKAGKEDLEAFADQVMAAVADLAGGAETGEGAALPGAAEERS